MAPRPNISSARACFVAKTSTPLLFCVGGPQTPENSYLWQVADTSGHTHTMILSNFLFWLVTGTPSTIAPGRPHYWPGVICFCGCNAHHSQPIEHLYGVYPIPTLHRAHHLLIVFVTLLEDRVTCWFRSNLFTNLYSCYCLRSLLFFDIYSSCGNDHS